MLQPQPVLEMKDISKSFVGVKALSNVQFNLYPGEVHALMGENGAGKSTLIKVLTGVYPLDQGKMKLAGEHIHVLNPHHAQDLGISTVYQEINLCPNLSVAENMFIGREMRRGGRIDWQATHREAKELLKRLNIHIDVTQLLSSHSVAIQQMVAIARALIVSAKILILDEPTSSLDMNEVDLLFTVIRKLKQEGLAILFVSHFIDQVYKISDRITVLRNGMWVGEYRTAELPKIDLITKMIGREWVDHKNTAKLQDSRKRSHDIPYMQIKQLTKQGSVHPSDLAMYAGEVIGLAGLLGSGRTELARLLFGADKADGGEIFVNGQPAHIHSPKQAIGYHISFCSEDRKAEGIVDDLTVRENMLLALQGTRGWLKFMSKKKQTELAQHYIQLLNITPPHPEQLIKHLSGGNQQKVLLARWLITHPKLLILDEPTRGIDVGAKAEIMKLIEDLSDQGMSIVFISAELEEVLASSQRIAVLRDHHIVSVLDNERDTTQHEIMLAMAGGV